MKLGVEVYNIESALKALDGGADLVQISAGSGGAGVTPSPGTVEVIRQNLSCDVYATIRPRAGDFTYSRYEFHAMKRDISHFQKISVDGFVFGILNADGTIDKVRCRELIMRAKPLKVICNRAFDMTRDPFEALEECIEAGFQKIVTSGQRASAEESAEFIIDLVNAAKGRIVIVPAVDKKNVLEIHKPPGVDEFFIVANAYRHSEMEHRNNSIIMSSHSDSEYLVHSVDPERIRHIRAILST